MQTRARQAEPKYVRVPIGFTPEVHEWLRDRAFRERRAMAEVVRDAVQDYIDSRDRQLSLPLERHLARTS